MPSPFPGVDPYLEGQSYWPEFHLKLINYCQEALNDGLPDHYEARIDERVTLVEAPAHEAKQYLPDVAVVQRGPASSWTAADVLTVEPVTIPVTFLEEETAGYIQILHRPDRTLVAVLEILSPGNKGGATRRDYLAKRNALLRQAIHLVELDFLIGGARLPMDRPLPQGDYYAIVGRADRRPDCDVYAWSVRQSLPTIAIPLLAPDPDFPLDLAAVFATAYERGRYARSIDYKASLTLPLAPEDRAWAEEVARRASR